jgi:hypothetical protein
MTFFPGPEYSADNFLSSSVLKNDLSVEELVTGIVKISLLSL